MADMTAYSLHPVGFVRSILRHRGEAPKLGSEGAPDAWIELAATVVEGLEGIAVGQEIILVTWFHQARRDVLRLHPRWDKSFPLSGVFATHSPDRPNPLGLHRVRFWRLEGASLRLGLWRP